MTDHLAEHDGGELTFAPRICGNCRALTLVATYGDTQGWECARCGYWRPREEDQP